MKVLHINILDKKASYQNRDGEIVCGNSDYVIEFAFDTEWASHEEKIARFIWNDHYINVEFTGTICPVPVITNATEVKVGVYAGDLSTTTPAVIGCLKSILCESTTPGSSPLLNGDSVFIRYSANADGTDYTPTRSERQFYIGVATGQSAPMDKSEYEWFHIASNIRATETITLRADAWLNNSQTIELPCVMSGSAATVSPDTAEGNMDAYIEYGVLLHSLGDKSLTFKCATHPAVDIVVVAEILDPVAFGEATLPEITEADNGKVLRVADGVWTIGEIPESSPMVELTTPIEHGATFTAEENEALTAALLTGKPVAVKCTILDELTAVIVMNNIADAGFFMAFANYVILLINDSGGWVTLIADAFEELYDQLDSMVLDVDNNTAFVERMTNMANNSENEGKVLMIKNGMWQAVALNVYNGEVR